MQWHTVTLRQKLVLGLCGLSLLVAGIFWAAMLQGRQVKGQFRLVSAASQLHAQVLESRHFAEAYIAKKDTKDYEQLQRCLQQLQENLRHIEGGRGGRAQPPHVDKVMASLTGYGEAIARLQGSVAAGTTTPALVAEVDRYGDNLTESTSGMLAGEELWGAKALGRMQRQFAGLLVVALLLVGAAVVWLWQAVFQPLQAVVRAAQAATNGSFEPLPLGKGPEEIRQVLMAFNSLVADLHPLHHQLVEAKKSPSPGALGSGAAHQLNNPLNNISTSCQIALAELAEGDLSFTKKMLNTIQQESLRASNIVRGLQEFSRSPSLHLAPGNIGNIVKGVLPLVDREVPAGVVIQTDIADGLLVHIDSQKMTEALLHLVMNSIQAMGEQGGEISISARANDEQTAAIVTVQDNGEGMDEGQLKKIFEPFFTTRKAQGGAGLGLSIVDGIIEKHQGRITVASTRGKGSEFTITLPLHQVDQDPVARGEKNKKV